MRREVEFRHSPLLICRTVRPLIAATPNLSLRASVGRARGSGCSTASDHSLRIAIAPAGSCHLAQPFSYGATIRMVARRC
jgi:hypothetical protein